MDEVPDPLEYSLREWLQMTGTRTGTATYNGVTYTNLNEVEWRTAHNLWPKAEDPERS